ncbi:MAG: PadR family transcriptional regulator [Jatrophihabitantaceae bacterium]
MSGNHAKGNLELLLMGVLRHRPAHGYAIIAELRERSDGEFDLAEGTIYPALHRLEDAGLIASSVAVANGRRRRTYALTAVGRRAFATQRTEWLGFVRSVSAVLG